MPRCNLAGLKVWIGSWRVAAMGLVICSTDSWQWQKIFLSHIHLCNRMLFWNIAFYIAGWGNWGMLGLYNYFRRFFSL